MKKKDYLAAKKALNDYENDLQQDAMSQAMDSLYGSVDQDQLSQCFENVEESVESVKTQDIPKVPYIKRETVNHPDHYKDDKYECIEVMKDIYGGTDTAAFCLLNAFKYLWRCYRKSDEGHGVAENIKKARWYLDYWLKLYEGDSNGSAK